LQGGEVAAGLGAVADGAERDGDAEVAAGESAQVAGCAGADDQRPEQNGGEHEPDREQRPHGGALVVGELAEDPHRAERGRGGETEEDAGGRHGTDPAYSKLQQR